MELEPLEERDGLAVGLGEDARVELEPGELAVQVERARPEVGRLAPGRCGVDADGAGRPSGTGDGVAGEREGADRPGARAGRCRATELGRL